MPKAVRNLASNHLLRGGHGRRAASPRPGIGFWTGAALVGLAVCAAAQAPADDLGRERAISARPEPLGSYPVDGVVGTTLAGFDDGLPGLVLGSSRIADRWSCEAPDLTAEADRPGLAGTLTLPVGIGPRERGTVARLATADDLAQTYWRLRFRANEWSALNLDWAFVSSGDPASQGTFAILLDGRTIACSAAHETAPGLTSSAWRSLRGPEVDTTLNLGVHTLEVVVSDGPDRQGTSVLYLDDLRLEPADGVMPDCRPAPPEALGEIRYQPGQPTLWTFDDNKYCPAGPGLFCSRPLPGGGEQNPNPGTNFVDSTNLSFEMYVVADCGTEMHIPLFDVESGCISVFDQSRQPVAIRVSNGQGFDRNGGEVCWMAQDCAGGPFGGNPGGPGERTTMDVRFQGNPTLCGVYILNFKSWAGCIWDLYANCIGNTTEQFNIYDDFCVAEQAVNPLPELVLENLTTSDPGGCAVSYCVDARNIGCSALTNQTVRVRNETETRDHVISLAPGQSVRLCGTLATSGTGRVNTTVVATADPSNRLVECSESSNASSCDPATGANQLSRTQSVQCPSAPDCDAGGPYQIQCSAAGSGETPIQLDGSGSRDPAGGQLSYAWSTSCPGTLDDPSAEKPVLTIPGVQCDLTCQATLLVTNPDGFTDQCTDNVLLRDTRPPTLVPPDDLEVPCPAGGPDPTPDEIAWRDSATASDTCGSAQVEWREVERSQDCGLTYHATYEFRAVDECGNESAAVLRTYRVGDADPPLVNPPADLTVECPAPSAGPGSLGDWLAGVGCTDTPECGGCVPRHELEATEPGCGRTSTATYRLSASDVCGNESAPETAAYQIVDTLPPDLVGVPDDVAVPCTGVPDPPTVTAFDACEEDLPVTYDEGREDGMCPDQYRLIRTWFAADGCGNEARRVQTVTVVDGPPEITGVPPDETVSCDAVPAPASPAVSDDCDPAPILEFREQRIDGACADSYVIERTWTARDRCGNETVAVQLVTVEDRVQPVLAGIPADATVECDSVPLPAPVTASDNCDPAPIVTVLDVRTDGSCPDSYTLTRTWTATDRCGNVSSASQILTVRDTTDPALAGVPADVTVECDSLPPPAPVTASDNCDPVPLVTVLDVRTDGSCPDSYTLTRTWTATDRCGNVSSASQTITVRDTTDPALAGVPTDVTVECDSVPLPPAVTASDNCDPAPTVIFAEVRTDGGCPDSYTLTRTWTATDRCGNVSSASQILTVRDTTDPALAGVPADATVECDAVPAPAPVTASDNCDPAPIVTFLEARTDGSCPDNYTLTRTWTATDRCGNVSSAIQVLTVRDTTDPALVGVPADQTAECDAVPVPPPVDATDNCDPAPQVSFQELRVDGNCPDNYRLLRTWTATDRCGNTASQTQVVAVQDSTPPVPLALLVLLPVPPSSPASPAQPRSPASARSVCSAPSSATFEVVCSATDNCDPAPRVEARLIVTGHEVPPEGGCADTVEEIPVACGEIIEIRLAAPPCPARSPSSPRTPVSVNSAGVRIVTGESVVLEVIATDRCGNVGTDRFDPAAEPSPGCEEPLEDGTCCPAIGYPPDPECPVPLCGRCRPAANPAPVTSGATGQGEACTKQEAERAALDDVAAGDCVGPLDPQCGGSCGDPAEACEVTAVPGGHNKIECRRIDLASCLRREGYRCEATGDFTCWCNCRR